jgi:hypothetical protein
MSRVEMNEVEMATAPPSQAKRRESDERGISVPIVAGSLVALLAFTALAVDLGWFYVTDQRTQRAADAAALAGVIELPDDTTAAVITAKEVATTNGFADELDLAGLFPQVTPSVVSDTRLEVEVRTEVPTFFLGVIGFDSMEIASTATAEYTPPLKLGSPDNSFGNACDPRETGCSGQVNFWANIHGLDTDTRMGDAYSSRCEEGEGSGDTCTGSEVNVSYRRALSSTSYDGYLYGIESGGTPFTVQFVDIEFHNLSGGVNTSDNHRTGDRGCEDWGSGGAGCGSDVRVTLYDPDATPLDLSDATILCQHTFSPQPQVASGAPYAWQTPPGGCWTHSGSGIYVLQVEMLGDDDDSGLNRYSVRADGANANLFGLRDISIYNNYTGGNATFYLAELKPYYAGKTLVIELYDPGEVSYDTSNPIQLLDPTDAGDGIADTCDVYTRDAEDDSWTFIATRSPCAEDAIRNATNPGYNGKWLKFEYDIPDTYTCSGALGCWWQINYAYAGAGSVNDTTTWRAYVLGNPIHLVNG